MAASVPRFIRQSRLGYLPPHCVIGSTFIGGGDGGNKLVVDIIMLPAQEFQRMKTNVGLHNAPTPVLKPDAGFDPGIALGDTKEVVVPDDEPDPEGYARFYFMLEFGLITPPSPAPTDGNDGAS